MVLSAPASWFFGVSPDINVMAGKTVLDHIVFLNGKNVSNQVSEAGARSKSADKKLFLCDKLQR